MSGIIVLSVFVVIVAAAIVAAVRTTLSDGYRQVPTR